MKEAEFTSSSGGVRAPSVNAIQELSGRGAMRNRPEPSQAARKSFESGWIAVIRGYTVATVHQHGGAALAGLEIQDCHEMERRRKAGQNECAARVGHAV